MEIDEKYMFIIYIYIDFYISYILKKLFIIQFKDTIKKKVYNIRIR